jgi:hypothetical protein
MKARIRPRWLTPYAAALALFARSAMITRGEWQTAHTNADVSVLNTAKVLAEKVSNSFDQVDAWLRSVGQRHLETLSLGEADSQRLRDQLRREV